MERTVLGILNTVLGTGLSDNVLYSLCNEVTGIRHFRFCHFGTVYIC
jgi:hypothetical protein